MKNTGERGIASLLHSFILTFSQYWKKKKKGILFWCGPGQKINTDDLSKTSYNFTKYLRTTEVTEKKIYG